MKSDAKFADPEIHRLRHGLNGSESSVRVCTHLSSLELEIDDLLAPVF